MKAIAYLLLLVAAQTLAADGRFCGPPPRDAQGRIIRDPAVAREFERLYPRPKDGRRWFKDHPLPMACGGCDSVANMQWLPEELWREKSKWERKVYGGKGISEGCP